MRGGRKKEKSEISSRKFPGLEYDKEGALRFAGQDIAALAEKFGTPLYVYSAELIRSALAELREALGAIPHLICYSVKANSNLANLKADG